MSINPQFRSIEPVDLDGSSKQVAASLGRPLGLSMRLFLLTVAFVAVAELLVYVPAIANYQRTWLSDRLAAAEIAVLVREAVPHGAISDEVERQILARVGARAIMLGAGDGQRVLSAEHVPEELALKIDLREATFFASVGSAWSIFTTPVDTPIQIVGKGRETGETIEVLIEGPPLRKALIGLSGRLLLSSLVIAAAAAALVFVILQVFIVRPVLRLARNITAFADDPERADRVIAPSRRTDEIGHAETALAHMEMTLSGELRQKRRLAELGLSVSKINHELRNLLTTAQLLGDRLEGAADPLVQRIAPRLVGTLDRAIRFCEATLAYGRAAEQLPRRRPIHPEQMLAELADLAGLASSTKVEVEIRSEPDMRIDADPEQIARVLTNLVRNAVQALDAGGAQDGQPRVVIEAGREAGRAIILVSDNGPGIPDRARAHLFAPFQGSSRAGGTGLGLAIAAELVALHGGSLSLDPTRGGTVFRVVIPDRTA